MGISKTSAFSARQNEIATFARAFAHPARVAIVEHLLRHKSCMCGELVEVLPLSQSTVSQHLKELKKAGIIKGNVEPPRVCYCIDKQVWERANTLLSDLMQQLQSGCC
ncbi:MAG: ArsR family transcriptional regulator [Bacteroidetes bacterium]|nr:MAG: ArsR family transcriptional regulator [Bacteroidota bacterium]